MNGSRPLRSAKHGKLEEIVNHRTDMPSCFPEPVLVYSHVLVMYNIHKGGVYKQVFIRIMSQFFKVHLFRSRKQRLFAPSISSQNSWRSICASLQTVIRCP